MGPANQGRSTLLYRILAGIQTGILGGAAMFGCLAVSSLLGARSVWIMPNLLGSALHGHPVVDRGFGWLAVTGLGLHLAVAGSVGLLFGVAIGDSRYRLRVTLLGIIAGLIWYYGSQYLFWRKLGIFVLFYMPPRPMLLAHLVFGLTLGWFPVALAAVRRHLDLPEFAQPVETAAPTNAVE